MKRRFLIFFVVCSVLVAPAVRAEGSLTDVQLDAIRTNCLSAQINLQRLQESDKRTRINRGGKYEALLRLMTSFNSRVAQNKIDAPALITIASDYQKMWDQFRSEYTAYDDGLTELIQLDCRNQPTSFYDQMSALRTKRAALEGQVTQFNALLDRYQHGVDVVKQKQGSAS